MPSEKILVTPDVFEKIKDKVFVTKVYSVKAFHVLDYSEYKIVVRKVPMKRKVENYKSEYTVDWEYVKNNSSKENIEHAYIVNVGKNGETRYAIKHDNGTISEFYLESKINDVYYYTEY